MSEYSLYLGKCEWDCKLHRGANGCMRRKNDPKINDDFCVGAHVCKIEWEDAGKCSTCSEREHCSLEWR